LPRRRDLVVSFSNVGLLYAKGVDPQVSLVMLLRQLVKKHLQVVPYLDRTPVEEHCFVSGIRIAPRI
jgi:hypothetical protein